MSAHAWIDRRTVLKGLGTAVALPLLEAMLPRTARGAVVEESPRRMAFLYVPNGAHMPDWTPKEEGPLRELPKILRPLASHQDDLLVLSGLALDGARSHGDGGGDHARSVASFLTGAHPRKTSGADIRNGASVDQLAAAQIGSKTRFPSLELGTEGSAKAGRCDSGYSCVYTSNISWRNETSPVAKEVNPKAVFERLFGAEKPRENRNGLALREQNRLSVLDFVREDARSLQAKLGAADRRKLDEYLYAVRQIEQRVAGEDVLRGREEGVPDYPRPEGVPREYEEHVRLLLDMLVLAFQTDSTRVASFMFTNAGSNRSYPNIGVRSGHHNLSHHGNNKGKQADISKINTYHVSLFAQFLDRLRGVEENGRSLLDNCLIMYGSGIGDGNRHNHDDLPIVLAGRGGGSLKPGRHVAYARNTPLTNLYLALLDRMGAKVEKMADSSGRLSQLS